MGKQVVIEQVSLEELVQLLSEKIQEHLKDVPKTQKEPESDLPELITRSQLSEILSVSFPTIHKWIKSGILTPYKIGNRTYFKRSEVMEYIYSSNNTKVA